MKKTVAIGFILLVLIPAHVAVSNFHNNNMIGSFVSCNGRDIPQDFINSINELKYVTDRNNKDIDTNNLDDMYYNRAFIYALEDYTSKSNCFDVDRYNHDLFQAAYIAKYNKFCAVVLESEGLFKMRLVSSFQKHRIKYNPLSVDKVYDVMLAGYSKFKNGNINTYTENYIPDTPWNRELGYTTSKVPHKYRFNAFSRNGNLITTIR
ncbi:hypothetical protein [Solirubrum puertoriconensis]|uniref:Uncharacterized protein n=1 Tax=Solirubrum puertoriconensis TaxID=1751427 RepID=A0A9X0HNU7_SOLP1|nr:hypothetical protein [Solirubrum puertoriconensis]KUG09385.1 hypothetical protein ASU33_16790 [Solirubrum puertoriconensis]